MADQETVTTTVTDPNPVSDTSTTQPTQEPKVDLASDPAPDPDPALKKSEDTRTDEEKAADEAKAELFGAPADDAAYTIEGLPEGMAIDADALEAVTPVFRQLGLSDKGASLVAQTYAEKVLPKVMEQATGAIEQQVVAQRSEWEQQAEAAIKSNGSDLKNAAGEALSFDAKSKDAVLQTAAKALDRLAPAGFREFLKDTGLSQHPSMVAFAYQAGKAIAEDTELETTGAVPKPMTDVEKFYGPKT